MDIIEFIVSEIVKNDYKSKSYIHDKETFLKVFLEEYNDISTRQNGLRHMIVNPEVITNKLELHNIEELQKTITKHLFTQLYMQNKISESEYEELCKNRQ